MSDDLNLTDTERNPLACEICRTPVNLFEPFEPDENGEKVVTPQHARIWQTYDHEPKPVPARSLAGVVSICDFCSRDNPVFQTYGKDVRIDFGNETHAYGHRWSACVDCDRLAKRGNVVALVDFIMEASPSLDDIRDDPFLMEAQREHLLYLHGQYVPSIHKRELIPPPPRPPVPLSPARLPKVRDRLAKYFASDKARNIMTGAAEKDPYSLPGFVLGEPSHVFQRRIHTTPPPEVVDQFCDFMSNRLYVADLFWISSQFTMLAARAGKKLGSLQITRDDLPLVGTGDGKTRTASHGLIVYGQPVMEVQSMDKPVEVSALGWCLVPDGIWLSLYVEPERALPDMDREKLRELFGFLMPLSSGGGLAFDTHADPESDQANKVFGTLIATWHLLRQPGIATVSQERPDKATQRSYSRARRPAPLVHIVNLRKRPKTSTGPSNGGTGGKWTVRVLVGEENGGFWRDQAYGPGRSMRKPIWIEPYLAGPEDAPLRDPSQTVRVLK